MNIDPTEPAASASVAEVERDVEERSAVFKKELGLFDLVLTQVVFVVGTFWVGWAARLGHDQNIFWILAIVTFYLPLINGPRSLSTTLQRSWSGGTSSSSL
jgi:predicted mannosyl-3-phosphoglycerate phosphatase (HAD superfamily)